MPSVPTITRMKAMSIGQLLKLRGDIEDAIEAKFEDQRRAIQERLGVLDRLDGGGSRSKKAGRGVRRPVPPKYRNLDPVETWAGWGLMPRWLTAARLRKSGGKLEDFSITTAQKKTRGRRRKAATK
jgi:DNA-binding protein H-NS